MLDIKQESYFPFTFKIFGVILFVFGSVVLLSFIATVATGGFSLFTLLLGTFFTVLGLSLFTTHYRLSIDTKEKTYNEYTWVLGFKAGKPIRFNYIEKIYVNNVNEKSSFTTRAGISHDIRKQVFKAFMKMDNGEKIHLDTDKNEDKLQKRLDQYILELKEVYQRV